jgi:hypothetical protein
MKNPSNLSTAALLMLAQEKIRDPKHWCQNSLARYKNGKGTGGVYEGAYSFCAAGAVDSLLGRNWQHGNLEAFCRAQRLLKAAAKPNSILHTNNILGHAAVMKMFDRAIELAQAEATTT